MSDLCNHRMVVGIAEQHENDHGLLGHWPLVMASYTAVVTVLISGCMPVSIYFLSSIFPLDSSKSLLLTYMLPLLLQGCKTLRSCT